jgi:hypothetical protein
MVRAPPLVPHWFRKLAVPDHSPAGINASRRIWQARVAVERLKQVASLGADVADAPDDVAGELALHLEAELVVVRRLEVL